MQRGPSSTSSSLERKARTLNANQQHAARGDKLNQVGENYASGVKAVNEYVAKKSYHAKNGTK
jgi:hypothetical protein